MKLPKMLLLMLAMASAQAADQGTKVQKMTEVKGDIAVNSSVQKLIDIPGVKPIYDECKKDNESLLENIPSCIWDKVKDKKDLKKAVMEAYATDNKSNSDGRSPASAKTNLSTSKQVVGINYESDPSVAALSEFYGKKLDEIIDPEKALKADEQKNNVLVSVRHDKFIDLYKSELGRTIVNAFTSYCIEGDPDECTATNLCTVSEDPEKREEHRKKNIASLKGLDLNLESGDNKKWIACVGNIGTVCNSSRSDIPTSKQRACVIVDYVKAARKNLMVADKQIEFYKGLSKEGTTSIASNFKGMDENGKASSDAILSITKGDVEKSLKKSTEETKKEMAECYDDKSNTIKNVEACKKFLSVNAEENNKALAEFGMRQLAQEEILKEDIKSDERVKDYLKEEGYSDDDIAKLTENKESIEEIRKQIVDRFKNEKEAIIKEMAQKISDKTSTKDGAVDASADLSKIQKIRNSISSRAEDLSNLVQFNNIISSYLTVGEKGGSAKDKQKEQFRNTASIFAESKTMSEAEAKALQEQIKAANLKENKNSSSTDLQVETLNKSFLNYNGKLKEAD